MALLAILKAQFKKRPDTVTPTKLVAVPTDKHVVVPAKLSGAASLAATSNTVQLRVEKRRVRMIRREPIVNDEGIVGISTQEAVDYVPVEILDAYVADARTRWPSVEVGTEHDPGPAGDTGPTVVPFPYP